MCTFDIIITILLIHVFAALIVGIFLFMVDMFL